MFRDGDKAFLIDSSSIRSVVSDLEVHPTAGQSTNWYLAKTKLGLMPAFSHEGIDLNSKQNGAIVEVGGSQFVLTADQWVGPIEEDLYAVEAKTSAFCDQVLTNGTAQFHQLSLKSIISGNYK
jgi:hypothetical protein